MLKKITKIIFIILITSSLMGCVNIQLFEKKIDENKIEAISNKELKQNTYYIKDGTKFYKAYMPKATFSGVSNTANSSRVIWLGNDKTLIPTLYKGESIAYSSQTANLSSVILERFKDDGYSLGLYYAFYNEEIISFSTKYTIDGTNANKVLTDKAKSTQIRIEQINDEKVTADMVNSSGIINCLEKGAEYKLGYYAGTYYTESTLLADTQFLTSYEIIASYNIEDTKNGYISISMPEELESGYYLIDGKGIFKYINHEKGTANDDKVELNIANATNTQINTSTDDSANEEYSVELNSKVSNVRFQITYDITTVETLNAILTSPSNKEYDFKMGTTEGTMICDLGEAIAGKWIVSIKPVNAKIISVEIVPIEEAEEVTAEETPFTFDISKTNITFEVNYASDNENTNIYGIIIAPDGTISNLTEVKNEKKLIYTMPYVESGEYIVRIYHYSDCTIVEVNSYNSANVSTETITVTEE